MSKTVMPHNTAQAISSSIATGSVPLHSLVTNPKTHNQTLLSLMSSGQISLAAMEGSLGLTGTFGGD